MLKALLRLANAIRASQYAAPLAAVTLIVGAFWLVISAMTRPVDTVVIEVVPLDDPSSARVEVGGAVANPGIVVVPAGSTVQDAVEAAGGFADGSLPAAELAAVVSDGLVVDVPASDDSAADSEAPVNINSATIDELDLLPGIGPALAGRIVAYRDEHGPFEAVDELANVSGISPRMVDDIRHLIVAAG